MTIEQYQLAATSIAATAGVMGLSAVWFHSMRGRVESERRLPIDLITAVCAIATFHYVLAIFEWRGGFRFDGALYQPSDHPFVNSSRYADWVTTLPLLAIQVLLVARLPKRTSIRLGAQLIVASLVMLALGYPGEISTETSTKITFLLLGSVPLAYTVWVMWAQLTKSLDAQGVGVDRTISDARVVLLASWLLYPVAYLFPVFGLDTGWGEAGRQTFYGIADLLSKPIFGWFILRAVLAGPAEHILDLRQQVDRVEEAATDADAEQVPGSSFGRPSAEDVS